MEETLTPLFAALDRDDAVVGALAVQFGVTPTSRQVARWRAAMKVAA